jgi:PAS domain S-box-containing protein
MNTLQEWTRVLLMALRQLWRRGLKIGYDRSLSGLFRSRVIMFNAVLILVSISTVSFSVVYFLIGYQYFYGPLYVIPFIALVLWLHHRRKYISARNVYVISSAMVIGYWCYEGRGNGNEYTLIGLATTSTLLYERRLGMYLINTTCAVLFIAYKLYDAAYPFVPDPSINYAVVPWIILLNSVAIASFQMGFFRSLVDHYDRKLLARYEQLNAALEKQLRTEEELRVSNERLSRMTAQLEAAVKKKDTELQSYVDAINVNIYSCTNDLEGLFLMVNGPLLAVSGYAQEELIGRHFSLFDSGVPPEEEFQKRRTQLLEGKTWIGEICSKKKDGTYFWYDCVVIPIRDENDQVACFLSLGIPITERKLHEQMRDQTRSLLESIAFSTSHNIRGPLARIEGLSNLVFRDLVSEAEFRLIAGMLVESSEDLKKASGDLMLFVNDHWKSIEETELKKQRISRPG